MHVLHLIGEVFWNLIICGFFLLSLIVVTFKKRRIYVTSTHSDHCFGVLNFDLRLFLYIISGLLGLELARVGSLWPGRNDTLHILSYKLQSISCRTFTGLRYRDKCECCVLVNHVKFLYVILLYIFTGNNHVSGSLNSTRYIKNGWSCCTSLSYIIPGAYYCSLRSKIS